VTAQGLRQSRAKWAGSYHFCPSINFCLDTLFQDIMDIDALLNIFSGGPCMR
jgi:ribosome-binding factor A